MKPAPSPIDMPRRSRSNGRHGAGSSSLRALNPMKQMRVMASTPPATATSTTPSATSSAASARATAPELHAVTTVWRGPPSANRAARVSACAAGSTDRSATKDRPRDARQYQASASSMPPPTAPTTSAASARSRASRPASASASPAAPIASRSARVRRAEPVSGGGTSAARRHRKPSVSMTVRSRIAQAPAASPDQYALTPGPYGLAAPRPVTTTCLMRAAASRR